MNLLTVETLIVLVAVATLVALPFVGNWLAKRRIDRLVDTDPVLRDLRGRVRR